MEMIKYPRQDRRDALPLGVAHTWICTIIMIITDTGNNDNEKKRKTRSKNADDHEPNTLYARK